MQYYVVDAFTEALFKGNPAGVCIMDSWPEDAVMQKIATENNLPETAFIVPDGAEYRLRWFTPEVEIDLCGHATLASAYIINRFVAPDRQTIIFETMSGKLTVQKNGHLFEMDFPARKPEKIDKTPAMAQAVGETVLEAYAARDLVLLLETEAQVRELKPDFALMKELPGFFAVIATAKGEDVDFVSRFFAPGAGIPEDPVTGSSHATLIPFWAERLQKNEMTARQLSRRGGTLYCKNDTARARVKISGYAALYMVGEILLPSSELPAKPVVLRNPTL